LRLSMGLAPSGKHVLAAPSAAQSGSFRQVGQAGLNGSGLETPQMETQQNSGQHTRLSRSAVTLEESHGGKSLRSMLSSIAELSTPLPDQSQSGYGASAS